MTKGICAGSADDLPPYGKGAPFRDDEASKDGARKVNRDGTRITQCEFALAVVEGAGPAGISAYGVFAAPDSNFRDLSTCRARLSDLKKQGKVVKKGERTPGEAGVSVNLWISSRHAPPVDPEQGDMFATLESAKSSTAKDSVKVISPRHLKGLIGRYLSDKAA